MARGASRRGGRAPIALKHGCMHESWACSQSACSARWSTRRAAERRRPNAVPIAIVLQLYDHVRYKYWQLKVIDVIILHVHPYSYPELITGILKRYPFSLSLISQYKMASYRVIYTDVQS